MRPDHGIRDKLRVVVQNAVECDDVPPQTRIKIAFKMNAILWRIAVLEVFQRIGFCTTEQVDESFFVTKFEGFQKATNFELTTDRAPKLQIIRWIETIVMMTPERMEAMYDDVQGRMRMRRQNKSLVPTIRTESGCVFCLMRHQPERQTLEWTAVKPF